MSNDSTAVDFGINLLEEEIDDVIFRTNEFLTDRVVRGRFGGFSRCLWLWQDSSPLSSVRTWPIR